ncbi:protease Do [Desulfatibacillum aliphaticivorans]|uniref:Probable periplasmic serine endoprotease DegP-like n=1 Tax=Desulfatibacillum aliphaticivorans TaxID=218208 RepID=B8FLP0_DESAL|nr:DegQ family serine endoprotease [Desulfatibacillum aliphaticivorans]ACL05394.1 protease Do [Desulfatibacillum aliphaticivorans]
MKSITTFSSKTGAAALATLFVFVFFASLTPSPAWSRGLPKSFSDLVEKASPSVVNISVMKVVKGKQLMPFGPDDPFHDFFEKYFGEKMPGNRRLGGLGTGFIIDKDGYILTNNHVVDDADEIKVKLTNDKEYDAKIVGKDPKTDLALIKIEPDEAIVPLPLGDSEALKVGDWVMAIGNPYGLGNTVTAGICSAKYRRIGAGAYDNFIQTDASINPGNSGGPLLNMDGEVVGINTAIFSRSGGSVGIGFAIPSNMAKDLLPQLKDGKVIRGWLGVLVQGITPELKDALDLEDTKGALVSSVTPGGPAEKAGMERGDVVVTFDGTPIKEMGDLPYVVASTPVGKNVEVEIIRKGKKKTIEVKIAQLQEDEKSLMASQEDAQGPDIGLALQEVTPEIASSLGLSKSTGVVISRVTPYSAAAEADLRSGDLIVELDGKEVETVSDANKILSKFKKGDTVLFLIERQGSTHFATVKVWE